MDLTLYIITTFLMPVIWMYIAYLIITTLRLMYVIAPMRLRFMDECKSLEELELINKVTFDVQAADLTLWTYEQVKADLIKRGGKQ